MYKEPSQDNLFPVGIYEAKLRTNHYTATFRDHFPPIATACFLKSNLIISDHRRQCLPDGYFP
jgi:hypothetical protein